MCVREYPTCVWPQFRYKDILSITTCSYRMIDRPQRSSQKKFLAEESAVVPGLKEGVLVFGSFRSEEKRRKENCAMWLENWIGP